MACNDAHLVDVDTENLADTAGDVAVARAVEAVAAHAVLLVETIGKGVHIRFGRHRLMECGVEHTHLLDTGKNLLDGLNAGDVGGIAEQGEAGHSQS